MDLKQWIEVILIGYLLVRVIFMQRRQRVLMDTIKAILTRLGERPPDKDDLLEECQALARRIVDRRVLELNRQERRLDEKLESLDRMLASYVLTDDSKLPTFDDLAAQASGPNKLTEWKDNLNRVVGSWGSHTWTDSSIETDQQ